MKLFASLVSAFGVVSSQVSAGEAAPPAVSAATTPLSVFRSIREEPNALAFSADGTRLLSASGFELLLWDVASARVIRSLEIPDMYRGFLVCAFSPSGKTILAASNDGKIATWDAETGKRGSVQETEDWMYDCVFSADCKSYLAVYQSGRITLVDMVAGRVVWEKKLSGVKRCELGADGKQVVVAREHDLAVMDAATGETLRRIVGGGSDSFHKTLALSPDGKLIAARATGSATRDLVIIETRTGNTLHVCKGHTDEICFIGFSPDGSMIATASSDHTLKLWNAATGKLIRTFSGHHHDVACAAFLHDGSKVLSASEDLSMKLWDCRRETIPLAEHAAILATRARLDAEDRANGYVEPVLTISPPGYKPYIEDAAFSKDGKWIISCSSCNPVRVHDAATGALVLEYSGHPKDSSVVSCAFSPDGLSALSSGHDESIKLWSVPTGKTLRTFAGHTSVVQDAVFSPDGSRIASVSWDKSARLWETATGKELVKIDDFEEDLQGCGFFPDGKSILVISSDATVRIHRVDGGAHLRTLRPGYEVTTFAIAPDGRRLFTGGAYEPRQELWDLGSDKPLKIPTPRNEYAHSAAFSPNGKWLVTGGLDRGIRIHDGASGALVLLVRSRAGHSQGVEALSFSLDGRRLLTGSDDGSLKIWDFGEMLASRTKKP
jgi:WD40 repeat protein